MRHLFFSFLLPFGLVSVPKTTLAAEYKPESSLISNLTSKPPEEKFYTDAARLVQRQIDLISKSRTLVTNSHELGVLYSVKVSL